MTYRHTGNVLVDQNNLDTSGKLRELSSRIDSLRSPTLITANLTTTEQSFPVPSGARGAALVSLDVAIAVSFYISGTNLVAAIEASADPGAPDRAEAIFMVI